MYVVSAKWVERELDFRTYRFPDIPESLLSRPHGWGKAGEGLVWCRPLDRELDLLSDRIIGQCCPAKESDALIKALETPAPNWSSLYEAQRGLTRFGPEAGRRLLFEDESRVAKAFHRTATEEFVHAYRQVAERQEMGRVHHLLLLAISLGLTAFAAAQWVAGLVGCAVSALLPFAEVIASDDFNQANGTLDGSTMSDGEHTWVVPGAFTSHSIVSNEISNTSNASRYNLCLDTGILDDVDVSIVYRAGRVGVRARSTETLDGYLWNSILGNVILQLSDGTVLGARGSGANNGAVLLLRCEGTTITGLYSGGINAGPVTDTTHSEGYCGIVSYSGPTTTTCRMDDFALDGELALPTPTPTPTPEPAEYPTKESFCLIDFYYGDPAAFTHSRFTDNTIDIHDGGFLWHSIPSIDVKVPPLSGFLKEKEAEVKLPVSDTFAARIGNGEAHSPIFVEIRERTVSSDDEDDYRDIYLFRGRVKSALRNPSGRSGQVLVRALNIKSRMEVTFGLFSCPQCLHVFGIGGCDPAGTAIDIESLREEATVDAIDGKTLTLSGLSAQDDRYWHRGFVSFNGLHLLIRDWLSGTTFEMNREPPAEWLGETVTVTPGCEKTITACRDKWDNEEHFMGFGYAVPNYDPNIESLQA